MDNELDGYERKRLWQNLRYWPDICLERLKKSWKNLSQLSRFQNQCLDLEPNAYDVAVLTTRLLGSALRHLFYFTHHVVMLHGYTGIWNLTKGTGDRKWFELFRLRKLEGNDFGFIIILSYFSSAFHTHIVLYMKRNMCVCVHRQATYFCNSLCISQRAEGNVVSFLSRCTKGIATGAISVSISPVAITLLQNSELSVELSLTGQTQFIAGTLWCLTEPPAGKSHYGAPIKVFYKASKSAVNYTRL